MSDSWWPHGLWNFPGQNTGVSNLSLFQGIFPTQGLNPGLLHCRQILYQLNHKGSPRILEWVVDSFSWGSSQPRNWAGVFCIADGFFTNWVMREAHSYAKVKQINKENPYILTSQFSSVTQSCPTLCDPLDCSPPGSSVHGGSPGMNAGVGCHARRSSQPRDRTQVSRSAGRFFTS